MADRYIDTPVGSLAPHKFLKLTEVNPEFVELPKSDIFDDPFNYMLEVNMDNYIELDIPRRQAQLHHFANAVMKRRAHGKLLRMCWDLNLMVTPGSIPYGSMRAAVPIF